MSDSRSRSSARRIKRDSSDDRRYRDRRDDNYDRRHRESKRYERDRYEGDRRRYKDESYHRGRRHHRSRSRSRSRSKSSSYEPSKKWHSSRPRHSKSPSRERSKQQRSVSREKRIIQTIPNHGKRIKSKSPEDTMTYNCNSKSETHFAYSDIYQNDSSSAPLTVGDDFDKEKIHREMQERLAQHLAREGKVYPPPKPQASHPIFANDGSFLETFKRMQEQQQKVEQQQNTKRDTAVIATSNEKQIQPTTLFGKRRGGKILKTGIVQKPKNIEENTVVETPNDTWAIYLQEVKKYKNVSCDADSKTRPLVK